MFNTCQGILHSFTVYPLLDKVLTVNLSNFQYTFLLENILFHRYFWVTKTCGFIFVISKLPFGFLTIKIHVL